MAKKPQPSQPVIHAFDFRPGQILAEKYEVIRRLGSGWEGEVYLARERSTGIERSLKLFFPQRNPMNRTVRYYAKKLHKLRHCPILIQYHAQEVIRHEGIRTTLLISDYVEGEPLCDFVRRQPGRRLDWFQGLHLLYALAIGIETIHNSGEYHGDLHDENVLVQRLGLGFDVKLLDVFNWKLPTGTVIREDVADLVRLFYDILGGKRHYARHPAEIKEICCGLKRSLIWRKFRTAGQLRQHLETIAW